MGVAFQAKRYQETVGSSAVRDSPGALIRRPDRGLLITTAIFTKEAKIDAARAGATQIELVDGPAIVELMAEYEFGLTAVSTYRLNCDLLDTPED
jgi:restriction system protein